MIRQRGPLLLILLAVMVASSGYASPIYKSKKHNDSKYYASYAGHVLASTDNWLGGGGNWSNPADWDHGAPGTNSDVYITTGSDYVTLDTSPTINSFTLGGASGGSWLWDNGTPVTLTVNGLATINQTGVVTIDHGDGLVTGALINAGSLGFDGGGGIRSGSMVNSGYVRTSDSCDYYGCYGGNLLNIGSLLNTTNGSIDIGAGNEDSTPVTDTLMAGSLKNAGTIRILNGSNLQVQYNLSNAGLLEIGTSCMSCTGPSVFTVGGTLFNSGQLYISAPSAPIPPGTFSFGSIVNSGIFDDGYGSSYVNVNGNLVNSGSFALAGCGKTSDLHELCPALVTE